MKLINAHDKVVETKYSWLWVLLFGSFYFIYKGIWTHAVLSFIIAILTCGLSWLIYPFFANNIVTDFYYKNGYLNVK
jgi:hypothetical protein